MYRTRIAALSIAGTLLLATACADKVFAPDSDGTARFAISDAQRMDLAAALRFAMREDALRMLADRDAAGRIASSLADVVDRVDANDRHGALRSIEAVRSELWTYRERASPDASGLLAIEWLSLALDHAGLLAATVPAAAYVESEAFH